MVGYTFGLPCLPLHLIALERHCKERKIMHIEVIQMFELKHQTNKHVVKKTTTCGEGN